MRVLVTRPEPGATRTAERLRASGFDPVVMPLTRIANLSPDKADLSAGLVGAYAVTSANAIRAWQSQGIDPDCLDVPLYAVGARTGAAATEAGFSNVRTGAGDGGDLARKILGDIESGVLTPAEDAPLVYVAGRLRHGDFESQLARGNVAVKVVETYEIAEISYPTDFIIGTLKSNPPDVILFYSAVAAERFFEIANTAIDLNILKQSRFFCMSENVADAVPVEFEEKTVIAAAPDENRLMALFDESGNLF
ncbi:uroporphyrinogen-III synthase [Hoeflea poritis]|uniref:Uroporphyrinogen-III synthase n=1 Tax=Hoeflea poritis TaxID=2993659 RepID=A0ABT4VL96_9HYPH|nr:uroporphyrinogen-III synthase [Hoeflea poritis]MDA4845491.1 uroporphyrinogen-III synthase [Hoeflea poritis]